MPTPFSLKKVFLLSAFMALVLIGLIVGIFWYSNTHQPAPSTTAPLAQTTGEVGETVQTNETPETTPSVAATDPSSGTIIPPTKTDCTDDLDTTCWNTYRNEAYGFEFRFPKKWTAFNIYKDKILVFQDDNDTENADLTINIYENKEFLSLIDYYNNDQRMYNLVELSNGNFRYLSLGNQEGIHWNLDARSLGFDAYSIGVNDVIFDISFFDSKDVRRKKISDTVQNRILNSLHFQ